MQRFVARLPTIMGKSTMRKNGLLSMRGGALACNQTYFSTVPEDFQNRPGPWDEEDLGSLLEANKKWATRMHAEKPQFFDDIRKGHAPKILWIGCADARVPANEIIGEPPGSVFVHRNIANMVVNTDFNCMSVIQYAIDVLKVKHIIICGHYDCGGVRASLELVDHKSPLENWLRNIRDTARLHMKELHAITDSTQRQRKMVELNVVEQCVNIFKTAAVQRRRVETHAMLKAGDPRVKFVEPRVHAFVYEPSIGIARRLEVDFRKYFDELRDVYDLYRDRTGGDGAAGTPAALPPGLELLTNVSDTLMDSSPDELAKILSSSESESADLIDVDRKKSLSK